MAADDLPDRTTKGPIAHRILLVEDDREQAARIKKGLDARGYAVSVAKDGGQAQSTFVMRKPDFVVLDLILPGESGFEICERLKQTDGTVPILVLSVIDLPDSRELAERVGANGYLVKPVEPDALAAKIEEVAFDVWHELHREEPRESRKRERRIKFSCRCGKQFRVSAAHRGKALTCPECGEPVVVPRHD